MAKDLLDRLVDTIYEACSGDGKRGERLTEKELNLVKFLGRDGEVLRNVYVPTDKGETSEIDVLFITQKGIFVIESKNYSGWIFGNEKDSQWTMVLPNKEKHRFYNPIMQNSSHIKWLRKYLIEELGESIGNSILLHSLIVFSERCELKKITVQSNDIKVIKRDRTYAAVRSIWESTEDCLNAEQIQNIKNILSNLTNVSRAEKKEHIAQIKANLEIRCPKCGGELVLRTAKNGDNAGKKFYGCSNYPRCRYIRNIDR